MDENEEQQEPKIFLAEAIFVGQFVVLADIIDLVLLIFALDDFFILDIISFPAIQIYLGLRGAKGTYAFIGNLVEVVPYLGKLPARTFAFFLTVYLENHPKQKAVLLKTAAPIASATAPIKGIGGGRGPAAGGATAGRAAPPPLPKGATSPPVLPSGEPATAAASAPLSRPEIAKEALGEQPTPIEKLGKLFAETPPAGIPPAGGADSAASAPPRRS